MMNLTGHDPLVYKNMIGYLESLSIVNLLNDSYKVNDTEFPSHNVLSEIYSGAINHNLTFVEFMKKYYPYIKGVTIDAILLIFQDH